MNCDQKTLGGEGKKLAFALNSFNQAQVLVGFSGPTNTLMHAGQGEGSFGLPVTQDKTKTKIDVQFHENGTFTQTHTTVGTEKSKKEYTLTMTHSVTCGFDDQGNPQVTNTSHETKIAFDPKVEEAQQQKIRRQLALEITSRASPSLRGYGGWRFINRKLRPSKLRLDLEIDPAIFDGNGIGAHIFARHILAGS